MGFQRSHFVRIGSRFVNEMEQSQPFCNLQIISQWLEFFPLKIFLRPLSYATASLFLKVNRLRDEGSYSKQILVQNMGNSQFCLDPLYFFWWTPIPVIALNFISTHS